MFGQYWVQSLGREDPLEKAMAIHSTILAWKNLMDSGAYGYNALGCKD